ncbi:hypothetical protein BZG36_04605 [Bifiguratus adelaidae]|uniref:NAD-dependent epimerase/dehydratase domain-containing protein n=1 Tax=Bifiguratus adelaidae TaxID=1938954 RepID=A0A261XXH5_9FUNG|nr:hypothetical protein BZG36_04605 [Bifiguratus adelaidae]
MRVLVLGATGFIDNNVAQAFARNGHHVSGVMRSQNSVAALVAKEIFPVVGVPPHSNTWIHLLQEDVDMVINCAVDMADLKQFSVTIISAVKEAAQKRAPVPQN